MAEATLNNPRRGYAICGEARSGTIYLCRLLASTGKLGKPTEVFHEKKAARELLRHPEAGLAAIAARTATPNGIYGIKLFSAHFDMVARSRWAERMPNLGYVHVRRQDLLGQALSLARAIQTRQYKASDQPARAPHYDRALIADCLARTAYGQARWDCWFARNGIEPVRLLYEDVVADPQAAVDAVASLVGAGGPATIDWGQVELRRQRDAVSDDWRQCFVEENRGRDYLDGGRLFSRWRRGAAFARFILGPR